MIHATPCLATPNQAMPRLPAPGRTAPCRAWPWKTAIPLRLPDQLPPVRGNQSVPQSFCNHPPVAPIGPQYMTPAAQGAEVLVLVRSQLAALDVIDVALI